MATVTTNVASIAAEGSASLTLFLSNLGEAEDTLLVTGPSGFICNHPAQTTLAAGSAAESYAVTCTASSTLLAGTQTIAFTVTSLTDSNVNSTDSVDLEIEPHRNIEGGPLLEVTMLGDDWSLPWNSTATYTVTVRNDGNEQVSGFLNIAGEHERDLLRYWNLDVNQTTGIFTVVPGGVATYMLTLQSSGEPTIGSIDFRIEATGTLVGQGFLVSSPTSTLTVEFEAPAPTEAELWSGGPMVNAANLAIAMLSGWMFAGLLIMWVRYSSKSRSKKSAQDAWDEATEEENKDADLSHGEIRADEDGTARCHACDSRIRLPTEKEAPFRFKCPTCEEMNRVMPPREDA
jgi:phage FluMu protein Com